MELLLASVFALFAGPLLVTALGRVRAVLEALDGFVLTALTGLVLLHVLPHAVHEGGWAAIALALAGLVAPYLLEGRLANAHGALLALALAGLGVHAFTDGAALALDGHGDGHDHLILGVILHRLPLGMFLWFAVRPALGTRGALGIVALIAGSTAVGLFAGAEAVHGVSEGGLALFEALVAGSLLHVVVHHGAPRDAGEPTHGHGGHDHGHTHHDAEPDPAHEHWAEPDDGHAHGQDHHHGHAHDHAHDHGHHHAHDHHHDHGHDHHHGDGPRALGWRGLHWGGAVGALGGVALLLALAHVHLLTPEGDELDAAATFFTLALESAPALLIAFVGAGLLQAFLDPAGLGWLQRGGPLSQAGKGIAFGLPLPVCSCGVLPLYESLSRSGMPAAAALAFLVATPELGLDAVLISLPLLGGELTAARLIGATITALAAALIVRRFIARPLTGGLSASRGPRPPLKARLRDGLRFGLGELVDHTLPWVLVGLAIAALLEPSMDSGWLSGLPSWAQVPVFALAGAPIYVCASGATPLVAVLLHKGVSSGAALAFLLTGPATNATTFGVLARLHGKRVAVAFAVTVTATAVSLGYLTDAVISQPPSLSLHAAADAGSHPIQVACLAALTALLLASLLRQGPRGVVRQITDAIHAH